MALFYADTSALVKLVREEVETHALQLFLTGADLISCELVLAELPRAIHRAASLDPRLDPDVLMARAGELVDAVALAPVDRAVLLAAGALAEPALRTLDSIHIAAAVGLTPLDGFLTYDIRQAATARLVGMRTVSPGPPERG